MTDRPFEVPERVVLHDFDDEPYEYGHLVGEAQPLPMNPAAREAARRRRKLLDELGGFGFRAST